jgi:hypothetical protein
MQARGFKVVAPPNLLPGPAADAVYLASYLQTISGPIVLVVYPGFTECFADGLEPEKAAVLAARLRPAAAAQFAEPSRPSAWKTIHS